MRIIDWSSDVCSSDLRRGKKFQDTLGDLRVEPERQERGDDAVPSEGRAVPGYARIRVWPLLGVGDQHIEVRDRPPHDLVEDGVGALDAGGPGTRGVQ